jgi:hypothetical protein
MKEKNENSGFLIIIAIISILIIKLFIIVILIGFAWSLISFLQNRNFGKHYWLTDEEKKEYKKLSLKINGLKEEISNIKKIITNLNNDADNEGLSRNQGGEISARSYKGKELRMKIDEEQEQLLLFETRLQELVKSRNILDFKPKRNWKRYTNSLKWFCSYSFSLIIYVILFLTFNYLFKIRILKTSPFFINIANFNYTEKFFLISFVVSFIIIIITNIIIIQIQKQNEPPFVTNSNIDNY